MSKLKIYLAGAIRDDHPEDIEWRETFIKALKDTVILLSPLAGKMFDAEKRNSRGGRFC